MAQSRCRRIAVEPTIRAETYAAGPVLRHLVHLLFEHPSLALVEKVCENMSWSRNKGSGMYTDLKTVPTAFVAPP